VQFADHIVYFRECSVYFMQLSFHSHHDNCYRGSSCLACLQVQALSHHRERPRLIFERAELSRLVSIDSKAPTRFLNIAARLLSNRTQSSDVFATEAEVALHARGPVCHGVKIFASRVPSSGTRSHTFIPKLSGRFTDVFEQVRLSSTPGV
jgi:hypothetical protein